MGFFDERWFCQNFELVRTRTTADAFRNGTEPCFFTDKNGNRTFGRNQNRTINRNPSRRRLLVLCYDEHSWCQYLAISLEIKRNRNGILRRARGLSEFRTGENTHDSRRFSKRNRTFFDGQKWKQNLWTEPEPNQSKYPSLSRRRARSRLGSLLR
jgi:hypothetical protein